MTFSSNVSPSRRVLTLLTLTPIALISADVTLALGLGTLNVSPALLLGYLVWIVAVALFWLHPAAGASAALVGAVIALTAGVQLESMLAVVLFCALTAIYCSAWSRRLYLILAIAQAANVGQAEEDLVFGVGLSIFWGAGMLLAYLIGRATRRQLMSHLDAEAELQQLRADHQQALDAERRSIARDLHDILAHDLTVISMQTQVAAATGTSESRAAALTQISTSASAALHDLRRVLQVLQRENIIETSPGDAPELNLQAGLQRFTERLQDLGFKVDTSIHGDLSSLPQSVEACLYRILQECTTNVVKHGAKGHDASDCTIEIDVNTTTANLAVTNRTDDSQAPAAKHPTSGTGLISMEDRAATFGGIVEAGAPARGIWSVQVNDIQMRLPR